MFRGWAVLIDTLYSETSKKHAWRKSVCPCRAHDSSFSFGKRGGGRHPFMTGLEVLQFDSLCSAHAMWKMMWIGLNSHTTQSICSEKALPFWSSVPLSICSRSSLFLVSFLSFGDILCVMQPCISFPPSLWLYRNGRILLPWRLASVHLSFFT